MRETRWAPAPVDLSVRMYTRLLTAYPGPFRAEYGSHMAQVFRDVCLRDYQRGGAHGMATLWARTSLDLLRTTVEEHIERGIEMNRRQIRALERLGVDGRGGPVRRRPDPGRLPYAGRCWGNFPSFSLAEGC